MDKKPQRELQSKLKRISIPLGINIVIFMIINLERGTLTVNNQTSSSLKVNANAA